ncbi:MAG: FHA domain-containing protein [Myxococcales bacterium]|nr:FHA domain-containing protein [Myxococcales bacterium]HRC56566.1 FHA domain-containing protein [Kofleriaceae bacterium]
MFKLVIQDDEGKTTVVPLVRDEITIGRKEGNTIRLTERNVSRRHARIMRANGEVTIEDLGSYNGIRVNNSRIAERVQLRVSDQVQIGDYKLFLKAEGIEHVDDAKTVPIERIETATSIDAVPVEAAPVGTPPPGSLPPPSQLVGNPNRTLVAIPDTDHTGRPIATPSVHGPLTAPLGHARLVVLSSNFAGSEFELSRPQMIIGRTDENDIVINHRSISRNHAKIVREPDTARYTVSDLQSSNGVRVNGQDYGKVELRRGDVIDLGHVRMRFVDAGEEYVFTRDAIEDVPEEGRGRGLWIALALAALVLGGIGVYFAFGRSSSSPKPEPGGDVVATVTVDAAAAVEPPAKDASVPVIPEDAAAPPPPVDAAVPSTAPTTPEDAGATVAISDDPLGRKRSECLRYGSEESWAELRTCALALRALKAPPGEADKLLRQADLEARAKRQYESFLALSKRDDTAAAMAAIGRVVRTIPDESIYADQAKGRWNAMKDKFVRAKVQQAGVSARAGKCNDLRSISNEVQPYDKRAADGIAVLKCEAPAKKVCTPEAAASTDQALDLARKTYDSKPTEVVGSAENAIGGNPCVSLSGGPEAANRYATFTYLGLVAACRAELKAKADFFYALRVKRLGKGEIPAGCQKFLGDPSQ